MDIPVSELVLVLFFLFALVLLSRIRDRIRSDSKSSYSYMLGGLLIFTSVAASALCRKLGLFETVPILADPVFFRVLSWIGMITGGTFLVSGVADWLPLAKAHRKHNRKRADRLELLRMIQQLAQVESRPEALLSRSLRYIVDQCSFRAGAAYTVLPGGEEARLAATVGEMLYCVPAEHRLHPVGDRPRLRRWDAPAAVIPSLPGAVSQPTWVLPVVVDRSVSAVFLLWVADGEETDDDLFTIARLAIDILSRSMLLNRYRGEENHRLERQAWRESVLRVYDSRKDIGTNMVRMARCITKKLPADFVSLVLCDRNGSVQRFSVGENGALLSEVGLDRNSVDSLVGKILDTGDPVLLPDIDKTASRLTGVRLLADGMRSVAAVPLQRGAENGGVLLLASATLDRYQESDLALLRSIAPTVANLVFEEMHRAELVTTGRRWNLISELLAAIGDSSDLEKVLNLAAKTMCNELRCSLVRISTYDVDGSNLKSRALAVHPGLEVERPAAAVMPLAALPYHRLIRDTGRMMLVNQESTVRRMCPDEQREVFVTGLGSALLVPIRAGHRVLGVVSLADVREWRHYRFEQADMSLVMSVASGLAPALRSALCIRSVTGLAGAGPIPRVESHRNDPASRRTGAGRQLAGAGELVPRT